MRDSSESSKIEKVSEIDLTKLELNFWSDEQISAFFDHRLKELDSPESFVEKNKWQIDNFRRHVIDKGYSDKQVVDMFIQREKKQSMEVKDKCIAVKNELEDKTESIMEAVRAKLAMYLPDWRPETVKVTFKIMEDADYRNPNNGEIEADLWRMTYKKDVIDNVIKGVAHELFHEWMNEQGKLKELDQSGNGNGEDVPIEIGRELVRARMIDEGLAVLISGQSLKAHHEEHGVRYDTFVVESFKYFDDFEKIDDVKEQKVLGSTGFKNMGQFYVVGYEMVRAILDRVGEVRFRELVVLSRDNTEIMFEEYEKSFK